MAFTTFSFVDAKRPEQPMCVWGGIVLLQQAIFESAEPLELDFVMRLAVTRTERWLMDWRDTVSCSELQ
jgi:hypothetical protein